MIIIQTTREMRSVCNNDEKRERENQTCQQWPLKMDMKRETFERAIFTSI